MGLEVGSYINDLVITNPTSSDAKSAGDDHFRLMFGRQGLHLIVVQRQVLLADTVLHGFEPFARLVRGGTVGQVAASVQRHAQNGVAGLDQRLKHALVGLRARVRLHVGVRHAEQLAGALDCQILGHIDPLAAAVIALARIAFGIFVRHHRTLRFHHGARDDVFRSDQFDLMALTAKFRGDRAEQFGVTGGKAFGEKAGVAGGCGHGNLLLERANSADN